MEMKPITSIYATCTTLALLYTVSAQTFAENGLVLSVVPSGTANKRFTYFTLPTTEKGNLNSTEKTWFYFGNSLRYFLSLAIDSSAKYIYAYDYLCGCIYVGEKFSLKRPALKWSVIQGSVTGYHVKLAADWMNHNIYWTDENFRWIGMRPMKRGDPAMYKIIISKGLTSPHAIALDPGSKLLFWSDIGDSTKIERSNLSGGNRSVLVSRGLIFPVSIAADSMSNRIFWVDNERDTIESIGYNNGQRKMFLRMANTNFLDIAIFGDFIYISDLANTSMGLHIFNKVNGKEYNFIRNERDHSTLAIAILRSEENNMTTEYCTVADCEHFCVSGETNAECQCKEGYWLNKDGTTCSATLSGFHRGLAYSNKTSICMVDILEVSKTNGEDRENCFLHTTDILYFEVDLINKEVIMANGSGLFHQALDKSDKLILLLRISGQISGLALGPNNSDIYWCEKDEGKLMKFSRSTKTRSIVWTALESPRDLVISSVQKRLFWISGHESSVRIESSDLEGVAKKTLISSGHLDDPKSLTICNSDFELYWIDGAYLKSSSLDGTNIKAPYNVKRTISLLRPYRGFLIQVVSTHTSSEILSSFKQSAALVSFRSSVGKITDIRVFDPTDQKVQCTTKGCDEPDLRTDAECKFGFQREDSGGLCKSYPVKNNFILVSDHTENMIYQLVLDGGTVQAISTKGNGKATGIEFNQAQNMVIWTDSLSFKINSAYLNGTGEKVIYSTDGGFSDRIALDQSTGNLYHSVVSSLGSYIGVISKQGLHRKLVVGLKEPRAVEVYPLKSFLFWTDHSKSQPHIGRATMNGGKIVILVKSNVIWPNGLAVDYSSDHIYWTDGYYNRIEYCGLDGSGRTLLTEDPGAHLMDIGIGNDFLYYTAWNKLYITAISKSKPEQKERLFEYPEFGRLDALLVYISDSQPRHGDCSNNNGDCSTFCLPNGNGRSCACEDGVELKDDGKTCENVLQCPAKIKNGRIVSLCSRYVDSKCFVICDKGYSTRGGLSELRCDDSGYWDPPSPCEEVQRIIEQENLQLKQRVQTILITINSWKTEILLAAVTLLCFIMILQNRRQRQQDEQAMDIQLQG